MKKVGKQVIAEFIKCDKNILDNMVMLKRIIRKAVKVSDHHLVKLGAKKFEPQGVTVFGILAESHICIHTYPEYLYAAVDIFTCGQKSDPMPAFEYIKKELKAVNVRITSMDRGI
ncbi:adenosylmethionine decarboxylase [bacterium]|nr:MAG: adenosylmethionine decarboxylase [bacterium]